MATSLITPEQAAEYGYIVTQFSLNIASDRIRGYSGQTISLETSTAEARGPFIRLPQRPTVSVVSVISMDTTKPVAYRLRPGGALYLATDEWVTVTYSHGWSELPSPKAEFVGRVALRIDTLDPDMVLGKTNSAEAAGSESASSAFGFDSHQGVSGLVSKEEKILDSWFPPMPAMVLSS